MDELEAAEITLKQERDRLETELKREKLKSKDCIRKQKEELEKLNYAHQKESKELRDRISKIMSENSKLVVRPGLDSTKNEIQKLSQKQMEDQIQKRKSEA